jgi:DNA-directed RNA polymerase alpha subunit
MIDPIPELPDDTPIGSVRLPTRIRNALGYAGLKTIGEVRETSDGELLKMHDMGKASLIYLRKNLGLASSQGVSCAAPLLPVPHEADAKRQ